MFTVGCAVPYTARLEIGATVPIPNVLIMRVVGRLPVMETRFALINVVAIREPVEMDDTLMMAEPLNELVIRVFT